MGDNGVNIPLREIYDKLQEVAADVKSIKPQLDNITDRLQDGEEALPIAKEALKLAESHDNSMKWLWRTSIAAVISGVMSIAVGVSVALIQTVVDQKEVRSIEDSRYQTEDSRQPESQNFVPRREQN